MINDEGDTVDLYIPRKCSWTNKLITAKDHASVQINIGHLDGNGQFNGTYTTLALAGNVRAWVGMSAERRGLRGNQGVADTAVDLLWKKETEKRLRADEYE